MWFQKLLAYFGMAAWHPLMLWYSGLLCGLSDRKNSFLAFLDYSVVLNVLFGPVVLVVFWFLIIKLQPKWPPRRVAHYPQCSDVTSQWWRLAFEEHFSSSHQMCSLTVTLWKDPSHNPSCPPRSVSLLSSRQSDMPILAALCGPNFRHILSWDTSCERGFNGKVMNEM